MVNRPTDPTASASPPPSGPVGTAPSPFHYQDIAPAVRDHILARIASQAASAWDRRCETSPTAIAAVVEHYAVIAALIDALLGGAVEDNAEEVAAQLIEAGQEPDAALVAQTIDAYLATADAHRPPLPVARVEGDVVVCPRCNSRDAIFQEARAVAYNQVHAEGGVLSLYYDEDFADRLQPDDAFVCDVCQGLVALPYNPEDPAGVSEWADTVVCIDERLGPFPAQVLPGDRWNGFLKPRFTREVAERIVERVNGSPHRRGTDTAWFEWDGDDLVEHIPDFGDERTTPMDGYYHIGAGAWVWTMWWDWISDDVATRGDIRVQILEPATWHHELGSRSRGRAVVYRGGRLFTSDILDVPDAFARAQALALNEPLT